MSDSVGNRSNLRSLEDASRAAPGGGSRSTPASTAPTTGGPSSSSRDEVYSPASPGPATYGPDGPACWPEVDSPVPTSYGPAAPGTTGPACWMPRAQVCSRPLDIRGLGMFRHAFIHDPPYNYAIRDLVWGNGVTESSARKFDNSWTPDDPETSTCKPCHPRPGQTPDDVSTCLRALYSGYAAKNRYRNLPDPDEGWAWGPNSNSFGAWMARCCHDFDRSGLGRLPGWNHGPAGPCRKQGDDDAGHEPIREVPMLHPEYIRGAKELMKVNAYDDALDLVVSGLPIDLSLCSFRFVDRNDAGEGLTTTRYRREPRTGECVPAGPSTVEIYTPAFRTLPWLVSTILHEYAHVRQHQRRMTEEEVRDPTREHTEAGEVDAYLHEIEIAEQTGLAADVLRINETARRLTDHFRTLGRINPLRQAEFQERYDRAMDFIADLNTGPPALPPGPHVYHHGSDYDSVNALSVADIEAKGGTDFGLAFYTHTKENWQLAKEWALRTSVGRFKRGWGVVTFPIPTAIWNREISRRLTFRDTRHTPRNAPRHPDTGEPMSWRDFVRYNQNMAKRGSLPEWDEFQVIRGPLKGTLEETDIRQVAFSATGVPVLNLPSVRSLRLKVVKLFRRP